MPKRKNNDDSVIKKTLTTVYRSLIDHNNTTEIDYFQSMSFDEPNSPRASGHACRRRDAPRLF